MGGFNPIDAVTQAIQAAEQAAAQIAAQAAQAAAAAAAAAQAAAAAAQEAVDAVTEIASAVTTDAATALSGTIVVGTDLIEGNVSGAEAAVSNTIGSVYQTSLNAAGQVINTTSAALTDTINAADNTIAFDLGFDPSKTVQQTVQQVAGDIGTFISNNSQIIETIGEDALIAGMIAAGVPAPLALAMGTLAADLVKNGGKLDAAEIGQVVGDAIGGPVGGALSETVVQSVTTGKIDLSGFAGAAADAVVPDISDAIDDQVDDALRSSLGDDVGGAVADELTSITSSALTQIATTGQIDPNQLAQAAEDSAAQTVSSATAGAKEYAQEQLGNIADTVINSTPEDVQDAIPDSDKCRRSC